MALFGMLPQLVDILFRHNRKSNIESDEKSKIRKEEMKNKKEELEILRRKEFEERRKKRYEGTNEIPPSVPIRQQHPAQQMDFNTGSQNMIPSNIGNTRLTPS